MSQTSYSVDSPIALPGMLADCQFKDVETYVASEDIPAGRFVVVDTSTDKIRLPVDTDDLEEIVGVTLYVDTLVGGSAIHKSGMPVPVIRKGKVWVDFDGGTATHLGKVRVHCDDSGAPTKLGKATASAASTDVITPDVGGAMFGRKSASATLKLVELNMGAVGPQGATGATGATGPTGPTGP